MKRVTILVILVLVCLTLESTSFAKLSNKIIEEPSNTSVNELSTQFITVDDLRLRLSKQESVTILDVRGKDYDSSTTKIKGATRIAPEDLSKHLSSLPKNKMIVTYCSCPTDGGSINAAKTLMQNGFKQVYVLKGGWNGWNAINGEVEAK